MAALSDQLLVATILAYLVAMICHAAEYALGNQRAVAVAVPAREPALVGAASGADPVGAAGSTDPDPAVVARIAGPAGEVSGTGPADPSGQAPGTGAVRKPRAVLAGYAAVGATVLAVALHLAVLVTRGIAADRMPWGNMYEFVLSVTFVGAVAWLVVLGRWPYVRRLGLFFAPVMVLLLGVDGLLLYSPVVPLIPALNSYWFIIHVSTIALSSGMLLFGFVPAVMYLIRAGYEQGRRSFPYTLGQRAPKAVALERLTFTLHAFAFPIFTFAVIAGAVWAEAAWGRPWGWDPKETWAFISWVIYAGYLHARATPSIKRTTATWIAVAGFLTMLMNLFGVNIFFEGLHSYGGVD